MGSIVINGKTVKSIVIGGKTVKSMTINGKTLSFKHGPWHFGGESPIAGTNDWTGTVNSWNEGALIGSLDRVNDGQFTIEGGITGLSLPNVTFIGINAFMLAKLTYLDISKASIVGNGSFQGIVNAYSTKVIMKNFFNTPTSKDQIFGQNNWNQITFTWV